jgi:hypothetical protein
VARLQPADRATLDTGVPLSRARIIKAWRRRPGSSEYTPSRIRTSRSRASRKQGGIGSCLREKTTTQRTTDAATTTDAAANPPAPIAPPPALALIPAQAQVPNEAPMDAWSQAAATTISVLSACDTAGITMYEFLMARTQDSGFAQICQIHDEIVDEHIKDSLRTKAAGGDLQAQALYLRHFHGSIQTKAAQWRARLIMSATEARARIREILDPLGPQGRPTVPLSETPITSRPGPSPSLKSIPAPAEGANTPYWRPPHGRGRLVGLVPSSIADQLTKRPMFQCHAMSMSPGGLGRLGPPGLGFQHSRQRVCLATRVAGHLAPGGRWCLVSLVFMDAGPHGTKVSWSIDARAFRAEGPRPPCPARSRREERRSVAPGFATRRRATGRQDRKDARFPSPSMTQRPTRLGAGSSSQSDRQAAEVSRSPRRR